ncbi:hypothetical protein MC885_017657 [Smutsia gigantea]|nr:hypothetical protein MC885_017657 [Smutsia gigantea]
MPEGSTPSTQHIPNVGTAGRACPRPIPHRPPSGAALSGRAASAPLPRSFCRCRGRGGAGTADQARACAAHRARAAGEQRPGWPVPEANNGVGGGPGTLAWRQELSNGAVFLADPPHHSRK